MYYNPFAVNIFHACATWQKSTAFLPWVNETIKANRRHECEATKKEVEMLSRLCNDERVTRTDVPKMLGKSYRQSVDDDDFSRIRHLPRLGTYLKLDALLLKNEQRKKK